MFFSYFVCQVVAISPAPTRASTRATPWFSCKCTSVVYHAAYASAADDLICCFAELQRPVVTATGASPSRRPSVILRRRFSVDVGWYMARRQNLSGIRMTVTCRASWRVLYAEMLPPISNFSAAQRLGHRRCSDASAVLCTGGNACR